MTEELIIFLDRDLYPGHSKIQYDLESDDTELISIKKSSSISEDLCFTITDEGEIILSDYLINRLDSDINNFNDIKIFSIYPEYVNRFKDLIKDLYSLNSESYLPFFDKKDFNEFVKNSKSMNKGSLVPRMKVNSDEVDTLKLAEMFNTSPSKCVKYQVKGSTPSILNYKGLSSFNYINELSSGVITPATVDEYRSVYTDELVLPTDTLIQYIPKKFGDNTYSTIVTKHNEDEGIYWYECTNNKIKENIYNLPERDKETCFYIYVKNLDKDYMSSICQGIHPLVVSELNLKI